MSKQIVIIDYGMGNLASVEKGFRRLGATATVSSNHQVIAEADILVLPGVGAFGDGMKNLKHQGLIEILEKKVLGEKTPFIGLCLGMQLLGDVSYEFGKHQGLGWIKGEVVRFNISPELRLPHIGWNEVSPKKESILFHDINDFNFYFVHSFHLRPQDPQVVSSVCTYGETFATSIEKNNIFATQFHPEKSQQSGLKLLANFLHYCHA